MLSDLNAELVVAYQVVRDDPSGLIKSLHTHVNTETHYYEVRSTDPAGLAPVERAARFIYLNKTAFNGLWRENRSGRMNSPFGHYENPTICDEERLRSASRALRNTQIERHSFADVDGVRAGDFIYCDPPYVPVSATANFTGYSKGGFGMAEQRQLVVTARAWASNGAKVVLSNAEVDSVKDLYGPDFAQERVEVARAINSKGDRRGKVGEIILSIG